MLRRCGNLTQRATQNEPTDRSAKIPASRRVPKDHAATFGAVTVCRSLVVLERILGASCVSLFQSCDEGLLLVLTDQLG